MASLHPRLAIQAAAPPSAASPGRWRLERARRWPAGAWAGLGVLAWLAQVTAASLSPPFDNAEQLTSVRSLQWGYHKHPSLPTVLLWPLVRAFGLHPATSYLAGALLTGSGLVVCRWLVRRIAGARRPP